MSDFQGDQNRSEILQSPYNHHNSTTNRDSSNQHHNHHDDNNPELTYDDTFSSYGSNNRENEFANKKEESSRESARSPTQLILSDNNFSIDKNDTSSYGEVEEEVHTVRFVVAITAAFPCDVDKEGASDSANKPRATEGPKPQNFYKFEYQLAPDDNESLYTADLVTYRVAAKLFPEKSEPRVLKSWEHENKIWVTWNQTHELQMTKTRLLKLFDHEIVLKIWDSKDFCSARTKFDKPKPFKFSKTGENTEEFVRSTILEQCDNYLKQIPKELHNRLERKLPNQVRSETPLSLVEMNDKITNTLIAVTSNSALSLSFGNKLSELAMDNELVRNVKNLKYNENRNTSKTSKKSSVMSDITPKRLSKQKEKTKKEIAAEIDFIKKNGVARVKLRMKILFAGYPHVITRIDDSIATIEDCFMCVTVENSLMSEQQLYDLNPISIRLEKVTDMPNTPIGYDELRKKCEKVYCSYSFFQQPLYRTLNVNQEKNCFFNDINVYLAGLLNKDELHEFLNKSPLEIEIHDRDRKPKEEQPMQPCLFGNDPIDDHISSVNTVASKHTIYNPFETKNKHWDPYGVAKLNLHELVLGKRLLEFFVPVLPCTAPDVLGRNASKTSSNTKVLGYEDTPLHAGAYLDSNTHLSVRISVAKPLFHIKSPRIKRANQNSVKNTCVFGRLIVRVDKNKYNIIKTLVELVRDINSKALKINDHPVPVQEAALSTYKLNEEEQVSKALNIITGFHLIDRDSHVFVFEGLKDQGIREIYEKIPRSRDEKGLEILYNSSISFSQRLYASLEVELLKIKLFESLDDIVKKPLLYIRDMTPKLSFEALIKLHELLNEYQLRNVIRCDLLPSAQAIQSMSREFGVPLTELELKQLKLSEKLPSLDKIEVTNNQTDVNEDYGYTFHAQIPHTSRVWTPIDNYNDQFLVHKRESATQSKDFVSYNIQSLQQLTEMNKHKRPIKHYIMADGVPYNYSSQALNSTELALNKFRDYINENTPNKLYTYNPEYHHSMTLVPVNLKRSEEEKKEENRNKWRTKEGWVYPDVKTTMQSNEHPRKLDQASLEKLSEPWEENVLHAYKMKSPLDRVFFKHAFKNRDFDVWTQPKVENIFPVTIFDAGDTKEKKEKDVSLSERESWKTKLIVENTEPKVHKLSGATEMKSAGFKSSNQLDRLHGLLKDRPTKKTLNYKGVNFNEIPALSVIKAEYEDEQTRFLNSKGFKAGSDVSMRITDDRNKIPVHYYDSMRFEKLKGHDFNTYGPHKSPIYKRRLESLKHEETDENKQVELNKLYIIPNKNDLDYVEHLSSFSESRKNSLAI